MKVNVFLFDDFDTMEAFAPAEVFGKLPDQFHNFPDVSDWCFIPQESMRLSYGSELESHVY